MGTWSEWVTFRSVMIMAAIGKNATSLITEPDKIMVKVVTKMKVKYGLLRVNIPYTYESTLKKKICFFYKNQLKR